MHVDLDYHVDHVIYLVLFFLPDKKQTSQE